MCVDLTPWEGGCHTQLSMVFIHCMSLVLGQTGVQGCLRKGHRDAVEGNGEDGLFGNSWCLIATGGCEIVPLRVCLYWQSLPLCKSPTVIHLSFWSSSISYLIPVSITLFSIFHPSTAYSGLQMPLTCPVLLKCAQQMTFWHLILCTFHTDACTNA